MTRSTPPDVSDFAAIDLGSNSFHMVVAREDAGQLRLLDRLREPVALGAGLDRDKRLSEAVQQRALDCLASFGQRIRGLPNANVRAVGTKTLRRALNAADFLANAERVLGRRIDVIPGQEEARLIYHGVRASGGMVGDAPNLVLDIGGASTEVAVGSSAQPSVTESVSAGCVVATQQHFADGKITEQRWRRAVNDTQIELRPLKRALQQSQWASAVGCSGSIKAIAAHLASSGESDGEVITLASLKRLRDHIINAGNLDSTAFDHLSEARRQVFVGGCAVLFAAFRSIGIRSMHVSQAALREGVLYELFGHTEGDVQRRTVDGLVHRFGIDIEHADRVTVVLDALIDSLTGNWEISDAERHLARHAARVHELGLSVSHSQFHKHGEMLLSRTDLPGFTRTEQVMLATLVRLQRRRLHRRLVPESVSEHTASVLRLAVLLRTALILCRDRQSVEVERVSVSATDNDIHFMADAAWLEAHPLTRGELHVESEALRQAGCEFAVIAR